MAPLPDNASLGIYLHIPFCTHICPYCDFTVEVGEPQDRAYLAAIQQELALRAGDFGGTRKTLQIGYQQKGLHRRDIQCGHLIITINYY